MECTLLSLTRPGLTVSAVMTGMSRHVTWGVTEDRAQTGSWYLLHLSGWVLGPSLWYSVATGPVHQSCTSRLGSLGSANHSSGSPQSANESACREYALIWKLELE